MLGYGASTKGNVLLHYCGITAKELPCIAEVNEDKYGAFTPGTQIPIVSEAEAKQSGVDAFSCCLGTFEPASCNVNGLS